MERRRSSNKEQLVFGRHPVLEALKGGRGFEKILLLKTARSVEVDEIKHLARQRNIQVQYVPVQKLNSITGKNHQGVIGYASLIPYYDFNDVLMQVYDQGRDPLFLMLDSVTDVRNLGAIARSAECFGVDALVIPARGSAMINADAIKASAGALQHIPVCKVNDLTETISQMKLNGIQILATQMQADQTVAEVNFKLPVAILMGSEGEGLDKKLLELADTTISIPMTGQTDSLNVSVSTGIVLYEASKQRAQS